MVAACEFFPVKTMAQSGGADFDAAMGQLAFQIAGPLEKEKARKVIVVDLLDANGRPQPEGRFLAGKLTAVLVKDYPMLEAIQSPHSEPIVSDIVFDEKGSKELRKWAKKLDAEAMIAGTFATDRDRIRISLTAMNVSNGRVYVQAVGYVPISDEMKTVLGEPVPAPKSEYAKAGINGVGVPVCLYCPIPEYTDKARAAKYKGTVTLQAVITKDGRAVNIVVLKGPGMGLEEKAIEAVREWRFRPAKGPDDRPVATMVPIEITFRLY
jgi:TonB family protein